MQTTKSLGLLSGGRVTKNNNLKGGGSDQMVVNISNFQNVSLTNQSIAISVGGIGNNIIPITSTVNNVLSTSGLYYFIDT